MNFYIDNFVATENETIHYPREHMNAGAALGDYINHFVSDDPTKTALLAQTHHATLITTQKHATRTNQKRWPNNKA